MRGNRPLLSDNNGLNLHNTSRGAHLLGRHLFNRKDHDMLPTVKRATIGAIAALAIAAAPAHALGKNERNFLKGVAATLLVTTIINRSRANAAPAPSYAPSYVEPRAVQPTPTYGNVVGGSSYGTSVYQTPAALAFKAYSASERRAIQQRLAAMGYYRSGIDGAFGPGTYGAVTAYARDKGMADRLSSREGAFGIYDGLIY